MQNRYTGDVGDFGKYGLLKCICQSSSRSLRLGVQWYLTPDETHNDDGKFTSYLNDRDPKNRQFRGCDPVLYDQLKRIVASGHRAVSEIERLEFLPADTVFFNDMLQFDPESDTLARSRQRWSWVRRGAEHLASCDLVFFDPDNGFQVESYSRTSSKGPKFVFFDELIEYYKRGQSLVIYNHRDRKPSLEYITKFGQLYEICPGASDLFFVRFKRFSVRDYICVLQPQHRDLVRERVARMLKGPWGEHFELHMIDAALTR